MKDKGVRFKTGHMAGMRPVLNLFIAACENGVFGVIWYRIICKKGDKMIQKIRKTAVYFVVTAVVINIMGCSDRDLADRKSGHQENNCKITDLTVNYEENPIGIDGTPLFGWRMESDAEGQLQTAYRIAVAESPKQLNDQDYVWDSGKIESGISVAVPYDGRVLEPEKRYVWKVSVWDKDGNQLESSEEAVFEMGLVDNDWSGASWIGIRDVQDVTDSTPDDCAEYQIEYDVRLGRTKSGFVWGMDTNQYGEYMKCSVDTLGESIEFSIAECSGEEEEKTDKILLDEKFPAIFGSVEDFCDTVHHITLEVDGNVVRGHVDGILVLETVSIQKSREPEKIGLWTIRNADNAYYDNIVIADDEHNMICKETFDNRKEHIFSPYYVKITDGWCEASSGFILVPGVEEPAPMLRCCFENASDSRVLSARLYAVSLGDYRIYLNGKDICGEYLTPGRSVYSEEVYYRTYDVTQLVNGGGNTQNVIGAVLGHGRYDKANSDWGDNIAFQAKLVIQYEDGSSQIVVTDESWQAYGDGPIRNDDMYLGEYYDASREQTGWCSEDYDAGEWQLADVFPEYDLLRKKAAETAAVKCIDTLSPISVAEPVQGEYVYDFGQNFNGNCQVTLRDTENKKGQVVTFRYAEALNNENLSGCDDEVGTIFTENLYTADNTDYYVIGGTGEEIYTPSLVCRGFRYVQITGVDEPVPIEDVSGLVVSTDNKRTGTFTCSDEKVNRLYDSIYWTQLSNYLDVPTDCPQRDERFGWAGDAQVFANTAAYNADVHNYLKKYVEMLINCQGENGAFPEIAPSTDAGSSANGWSDAGIILVWELYQQYGDREIIRENLGAMCRYMDYLVDTSDDFIRTQHGYSDHNAVSVPDDDIVNTAQCAYVAKLLSKMSTDIGEIDIAKKYDMVYNQYKKAWQDHYINADGSIDCWLQSAYTLGLAYGLYPEGLEAQGAACLNNAVAANEYHLNTGYIGTQFLLPVLCKYGYADTAYRILQQDSYPSWNNMLSYGQTTLTEAWFTCRDTVDGLYAINGSLNHPGLGTVGQWLYSDVLGIRRDESNPGFKHFYIQPLVGGGLTYASGSYESVYGMIESSWKLDGNEILFCFTIPANTTATVSLPDAQYQNMELGAGRYEYRVALNQ